MTKVCALAAVAVTPTGRASDPVTTLTEPTLRSAVFREVRRTNVVDAGSTAIGAAGQAVAWAAMGVNPNDIAGKYCRGSAGDPSAATAKSRFPATWPIVAPLATGAPGTTETWERFE
jgi:hypothetical protein